MKQLSVFIVCGEHSGDALGAKLMDALSALNPAPLKYAGVGGELMAERGFESIFPLADVAVMGPLSILPKLPRIVRRVYQTVDAALAADPDIVVIIDSPEFTHPIAKRIRKRRPDIPIVDYVSPTVWAWRPGRARKMKPYVDHLLALLPFEPEAHARLGGPPCTYVGHPLIERLDWLHGLDTRALSQKLQLAAGSTPVVLLPGSRASEIERLLDVFGATLARLQDEGRQLEVLLPAVPHLRDRIVEGTAHWPFPIHILDGEANKFTAFRLARAALAASGTVTLELALAGAPMVVAYRVDPLAARLRFLVNVPSVVLANLVLGENAFPEFLQEDCTADKLAAALAQIIDETPARAAQCDALSRLSGKMELPEGSPSEKAAAIVLQYARQAQAAPHAVG
jgi:lipid-A-disaccharide synthase